MMLVRSWTRPGRQGLYWLPPFRGISQENAARTLAISLTLEPMGTGMSLRACGTGLSLFWLSLGWGGAALASFTYLMLGKTLIGPTRIFALTPVARYGGKTTRYTEPRMPTTRWLPPCCCCAAATVSRWLSGGGSKASSQASEA